MGRQPRDFLPKNERERLRSLLKQHGGDLSKFCDELDDVTVVSDIFGSDSRADKVTTLVAEVPRRESVIDVDEHSNEAKDVLTRLQEGTRILSLGCSLCYPQLIPSAYVSVPKSAAIETLWHTISKLSTETVLRASRR